MDSDAAKPDSIHPEAGVGLELGRIWAEHSERIRRAALMLCGNPWDADDLTQETFLLLADDPSRFGGRSRLSTWLYGVLLNLDRHRRRRLETHRRKLQDIRDGAPRVPLSRGPVVPAESALVADEWRRGLWAHVHRLPEGQRESLVLRFSEELRYEEIADVMGCPVGTVKSRVFHGLIALRQALQGKDESMAPEHPEEDYPHAG